MGFCCFVSDRDLQTVCVRLRWCTRWLPPTRDGIEWQNVLEEAKLGSNWSAYDFIHSKRRNKLTSSRGGPGLRLLLHAAGCKDPGWGLCAAASAVGGGQQQ